MIATRTSTTQPPTGPNPSVFLDLGVATIDGMIPVENLPVGMDRETVAAGNDSRFSPPLSATPGRAREVWIDAGRTDGSGTGTCEDPYDGSTEAKFDALLTSLPQSIQINLLPGLFLTKGSMGFALKEGWIIRGAGMDLTTVRLVPAPANPDPNHPYYNAFNNDVNGLLEHAEIHDLTIDGNVQNQPSGYSVQGGGVFTALGVLENLRLINWGSSGGAPNTLEQFGLVFSSNDDGSHVSNGTIRGCIVTAPVGGGSMLCFFGVGGPAGGPNVLRVSGVIENNFVIDGSFGNAAISCAGAVNGVRVVNNRVYRAYRGFHQDTGAQSNTSRGLIIANNFFESCTIGVGAGGNGDFRDYMISGNVITLSGATPHSQVSYGVYLDAVADPENLTHGTTQDFVIQGNFILPSSEDLSAVGAPAPGGSGFYFVGTAVSRVTVKNNTFDPAIPGSPEDLTPYLAYSMGNRTTTGERLVNLPDTDTLPFKVQARGQGDGIGLVGGGPASLSPSLRYFAGADHTTFYGELGLAGFPGAFSILSGLGDLVLHTNATNLLLGATGAGKVQFYSGTLGQETVRGTLFPSGGFNLGGAADPGAGNFSVAGVVTGIYARRTVAVSANYTLSGTEGDVEVNPASGSVTVTLFSPSAKAGYTCNVANVNATNNVTLACPASTTFTDGSTSKTITPNHTLTVKVNSAGSQFIPL